MGVNKNFMGNKREIYFKVSDKQQHTFTIELLDGSKMLIKGRNLYKNGVLRRKWENEENRKIALDEKHDRGAKARVDRNKRKSEYEY